MTVLRDISMLWSLFHILILFMLLYRSRYPRKKTLIRTGMTKRQEDLPVFLLLLLLMPMTYATIFAAMYRQLLLHRKRQSERVLQEQKNTLEAQLDSQQSIRKMKHDIKGYTATLSGLLSAGKIKEAEEYLAGVEQETDVLSGQFCPNPYINATLAYYDRKLEELSASCRMDIQIGEEELPYMELCRILADGLENVCDALKKLEEGKREVSVHMRYRREYLLIRIKNRCPDELHVAWGGVVPTSKTEPGHGFGLPAIQEAAKRLDGEMFCYTEDGYFILDVMVSRRVFPNTG